MKREGGKKLEDGEYLLPDATKLEVKDGKVTKITHPTPQEIAARMRADMNAFRAQMKDFIARAPFKAKKQKTVVPGADRVPYIKAKQKVVTPGNRSALPQTLNHSDIVNSNIIQ